MLGHGVSNVVLGVDFDHRDDLVDVDTFARLGQRAVDVLVRGLHGDAVDHGQDACVVNVDRRGRHAAGVPAFECCLDAAEPDDGASRFGEGGGGSVGGGVGAFARGGGGSAAYSVDERSELAVIDTRVDPLAELAAGGDGGAVDFDDVPDGGAACIGVVGVAGVGPGLDAQRAVRWRRVGGVPAELDAVALGALKEAEHVLQRLEVRFARVEAEFC